MATPEVNLLFHQPISDHAFNADRSLLAVARENNVELFTRSGKGFTLKDELKGHDKTVTSVDISPVTGRIVTCSQDRNALVWEPTPDAAWKPTLVLLRLNRAATFVRWSPDASKFAVGSGARAIAICFFEEENDWWVSKHIKKPLRSTVLSVAWHPNSVLLAAGSTDAHARVFSSFIKGVDNKPAPTAWGERIPFNTVCGEFINNSGGWVHAVDFSPSGDTLAFVAHDSSVTLVYPSAPEQPPRAVITVTTPMLPFVTLAWLNENELVAGGHDCQPIVFQGDVSGWKMAYSVDDPSKKGEVGEGERSALNMFKQMDLKGKDAAVDDSTLRTVHQNTIVTIRPYEGQPGNITKFSSTGVDGRIVIFQKTPRRA
ncbi:WD repeat domain-containing protein [Terfezia claveryi]|nr:WD repeat domain-containing protein [Terfezia claveryi]